MIFSLIFLFFILSRRRFLRLRRKGRAADVCVCEKDFSLGRKGGREDGFYTSFLSGCEWEFVGFIAVRGGENRWDT